jgi:hypothetical protein
MSQTTFSGNNCKNVDTEIVNAFRKENFSMNRPFLLPLKLWVISLHIPQKKTLRRIKNGNLSLLPAFRATGNNSNGWSRLYIGIAIFKIHDF